MFASFIRLYHINLSLSKKTYDNLLQSYKKTYGINTSIAKLFCNHIGYSYEYPSSSVPMNYLSDNLKKLLIRKSSYISSSLRKQVEDNLGTKIKIKSYQGNCLRHKLPLRGQRRRTNANTSKKLLGQFLVKLRK